MTLIGLALTAKALLYGIWPALALRSMRLADALWRSRAAGVVAIVLGLACGWVARLPAGG